MDTHITFRSGVKKSDLKCIEQIARSSKFFEESPDEIPCAVQDAKDTLALGEKASGSSYVFAELNGKVVGFVSFGKVDCTIGTYMFYWIAVDNSLRGQGIGFKLMNEGFKRLKDMGAKRVFLQTAGRRQYAPTRAFYIKCGYKKCAVLKDYYTKGDSCVMYSKYF